ncbi:MAG: NAD-binding protein [Hyphomonadaceae bacterium]|nr:NAD-binding protein [Hyphomonadaceae bacterium]
MRRSYANFWSRTAAGLTAWAHTRAAVFRWGVVAILTLVWILGGLYHFIFEAHQPPLEAFYKTIAAIGMWDDYFNVPDNDLLQIVRYSAIATPVVGLIFAFSGQLGRGLARMFNLGAAHHVVIAGDGPPALTLALDARAKGDAVILIGQDLPEDTALGLRRRGVIVLEGDAKQLDTLKAARADHAAHVVAFADDDTENLQIEAVMRRLAGDRRRHRRPVAVHVATRAPILLREAREMRSLEQSKRDAAERAGKPLPPAAVDAKPFSLDELAARALIQAEAGTILDLAEQLSQPRPHIVIFGFDEEAEQVAVRTLASLWSARLEPPRLTVCTREHERAKARFEARYPQAVAHTSLWVADIAFREFDWATAKIDVGLIQEIAAARGPVSAIVVSTGSDADNILISLALKRTCNQVVAGARTAPAPIFMRETSQSEFSRTYARGDDTPDELDAYLQAFGAHQVVATRAYVLDGALDMGAAIAHRHYAAGLSARGQATMKDLQAAAKGWDDVLETYRDANRSSADSAMVKLWDAGWRRAESHEREGAEMDPAVPDEMMTRMAQREHDRWMADRLLGGWRPGEKRDNELRVHNNLKPWSALTPDEQKRDEDQIRAAVQIGRTMHRHGFMKRG